MADEKAILSKLEAAELRIGMCDEKALTKLLDPALPNLLPFLGSPFASVRTKTMAILSHLNKRIKGDATIQLPLEGLRKAFAAATSPLVANFALVYLEMGFPRAASTERASLVPPLLVGISSRPAAQQETLLGLLAITLSVLPLPKTEAELQGPAATLPFLSAAADRKLTLEWCRDMLLYLPPLSELPAAGLSPDAAKRVCGRLADNEVRGELLAAKKLAICRLLSAQTDDGKHKLFSTAETLSHWVIAACDSNGNIALHAETALRQASDADLEEVALVDELVVLLLGAEGQKRLPASVPVQLRAIALLQKSVAAAGRFPGILQVIFTTIFNGRPPRLAEAGCRLSTWVASHAPLPMLAAVGAHLLAGMVKVLHADGIGEVRVDSNEAIAMRSAAYATLTALCQRLPAIVAADLELPANLFHALAVEQVGARSALQEALAALAEVHAASSTRPTGAQQHALQALLLRAAAADSHHSRYCAMIWAGKAFASDDVIARYICFLGLGDERREVHEASLRSLRPPRSAAVTPGAPAPPPPPLEAGQRVSHRDGRGDVRTGIIAQLHSHGGEAYYTVALDGGGEVQTEAAHLARLAPGWPSLRACVGCVVANTALRPPPRAVGEWLLAETAALQALQPPPLPARGLAEVLRYLFELLEREAEHLEARRAGLAATGGSEAAGALAAHLQRCLAPAAAGGEEVAALLELLYASLQAEGGAEQLLAEASERLLRLLEAAPAALAPRLQECLGWMQQLALSKAAVDEATQSRLCAMMALTCRSMPAAKVEESLGSLVPLVPLASTPCVGLAEQRKAIGAMVAVGLIGSYQLEAKASGETLALLTRATLAMAALLTHDQAAVAAAAAASIGALGSLAPLPLPDGEAESGGAAEAASSDGVAAAAATPPSGGDEKARPPQTKLAVAARLLSLLDKLKTKEKAVLALGQLGHGEPHGIFRNDILSGLFGLAATKDVDLHLTVGESLAKIGTARPSPDAAASASRLPPLPPITIPRKPLAATAASGASAAAVAAAAAQQPNAEEAEAIAVDASLVAEASGGAPLLGYVLQKVLRQYIVDYKPLLRQAAVAWLLSIMKVAAQAPEMLKAAPDVQDALLKLLADSNEVTQELASKGLSILYDACDAETQERIVAQLVKGLQASRAASASSSGGDMATFSELSEIANNAGQPELVYKLMELSTASAVWNTRKGVAFALAEQSRGRLQKHLDKLVPTLYRYTFDPNPKIAAAMKQVWEALVPEPKKALAAHFNAVLSHVREGLTDRLWRSREASCSALAELLSGRTYDEVGEVMGEIQQKLMRALDDIKESVRKAALAAWRALTSAAVRLVDQTNSHREHARELLDALLPTLLDQGISHAQDEVRRLCTRQLLKICEAAGSAMQPHVVRLVPVLLESLSVVEDPMLNYLQLNAGQAGISDQALETARVNAMRSSDVSAVLDQCLRMMGEREVSDALPAICALLSRGTGLPTRSGTARFVLQLAQLQPLSVEPHSAQLLRVLRISTLSERSDVARKAYASAAAQVARNAPVDTLGELVIHLVGRYTSDEAGIDDDERMAITTLMRELLRSASDAMARVKSDWLPLAFIARHEPRSQLEVEAAPTNAQKEEKGALSLVWGQAFDEAGIGPSAVGLYVGEILQLIGTLIEGTSWALRRAAAYALVELTSSAKTAIAAKPELGAEVERLAGLLCDKKWRDKEDLVSKVAALLPVPPPRADAEQPEDASSADM